MAYQYIEHLSGEARKHYGEKMTVARLNMCLYRQFSEGLWREMNKFRPEVEFPDIYECLHNTPGKELLS